jgi:protein SCO1/2
MVKRAVIIGVALLILGAGAGVLITQLQPYEYNGVFYENPKPAAPINLVGRGNHYFDLADHREKVIVLFFGYTSCPDVCPSTMSDMKRVASILGEDAAKIQVVFVTVDPERDTAEKLDSYISLFDPNFIGLTGTEDELEEVWSDYGVFREIDTTTQTAAGYLVNHSSRLYVIDPGGNLVLTYSFGTLPEDIAEDIEHLLEL